MSKIETVDEPLPTQGGEYLAYEPEYQTSTILNLTDGWQRVPTYKSPVGIPEAGEMSGINCTINMHSFAAANALAWMFAAHEEHRTGIAPKVRVVGYRVKYDIKCYREKETP
jgi:hypothetical protein